MFYLDCTALFMHAATVTLCPPILYTLNRNMPPAPANVLGSKPLDGGWGWMVVIGAHISIGFAYSTPKALSIFFKDIQEDLQAGYSEIAWISSIMLAAMYAGGELTLCVLYWLNCF